MKLIIFLIIPFLLYGATVQFTIGTGETYTTWVAFQSAEKTDLDVANDIYEVTFKSETFNEYLKIESGWNTSSSDYLILQAQTTGEAIFQKTDASPNFEQELCEINTEYVQLIGLVFDGSNVTNGESLFGIHVLSTVADASEILIDKCIIRYITNSTTDQSDASNVIGIYQTGGRIKLSNSMIYDLTCVCNYQHSGCFGMRLNEGGTTNYIYNNTIYDIKNTVSTNSARGIYRTNGTVYARNNIVCDVVSTNGSEYCYSGTMTQQTNVSSDATATGYTNKTSYSTYFKNVTGGSEDLHLKADSNTLFGGYGTDLDSDANLAITDDIDEESRDATQPDCGADEYVATTTSQVIFINQF